MKRNACTPLNLSTRTNPEFSSTKQAIPNFTFIEHKKNSEVSDWHIIVIPS